MILTPELIIAITGLVTGLAKIYADKKAGKKHDKHELGKAAWLIFVGAEKGLPSKKNALQKWRRIAENLASAWGIRINAREWFELENQTIRRWELESRSEWDTAMAALLESAVGIEKWANGIAPEILKLPGSGGLPRRADTEPPID